LKNYGNKTFVLATANVFGSAPFFGQIMIAGALISLIAGIGMIIIYFIKRNQQFDIKKLKW